MPETTDARDKVNRAKYNIEARLRNTEPKASALLHDAPVLERTINQVVASVVIPLSRAEEGRHSKVLPCTFDAERLKTMTPEQVEGEIMEWLRDAIDNRNVLEQEEAE